ncbi:MAG: YkoP family protein [Symbiobacteriia bacterium]
MKWIRLFWDAYERLFAYVLRFRSLAPGSLIRVRSMTYRGRPLQSGEEALLPGARVFELHLDNRLVEGLAATGAGAAFRVRERLRTELPLLLRAVRGAVGNSSRPVAGVIGTGLLAVGARGIGFHVEPLPSGPGSRWLALYMRWLARLYRAQAPAEAAVEEGTHGPPPAHRAASPAHRAASPAHRAGPSRASPHGRRTQLYLMWITAAELERLVQRGPAPAAPKTS